MSSWFTVHTLVAFILGVMLAASVRNAVSRLKSTATGG